METSAFSASTTIAFPSLVNVTVLSKKKLKSTRTFGLKQKHDPGLSGCKVTLHHFTTSGGKVYFTGTSYF
jgi:hypothetical protein